MYRSQRDLREHARPARANPPMRRVVEVVAAIFMFFSAIGPNMAAPIPRKKMLRQNVNPI
jgi:hypothetical protein